MLTTLQAVLKKAQRGRYAVGSFNIYDLEQAQAVVMAARKLRSPVIISTSETAINYAGLKPISDLVHDLAKKETVPIVLNLDHGHDLSIVKSCLQNGYGGIMFDGSRHDFKRNVLLTKRAVQAAGKYRVGVEGELGQVKYLSEIAKNAGLVLTDPTAAADYVRHTGVCALAVAIGNAHGVPRPHEHLDLRLLRKIRTAVAVPLVLHGASSTSPVTIRAAIKLGICKININTDLRQAFTASLRTTLKSYPREFDPCFHLSRARQSFSDVVMKKIVDFGSKNKGL